MATHGNRHAPVPAANGFGRADPAREQGWTPASPGRTWTWANHELAMQVWLPGLVRRRVLTRLGAERDEGLITPIEPRPPFPGSITVRKAPNRKRDFACR